jgi:hypothetical protein
MSDYQLTYSSSSLLTSVNMLFIKHFAIIATFLLFGSTVLAIPQAPKKRYRSRGSVEKRRIQRGDYAASTLTADGLIRLYPDEWKHRVAHNLCLCCGDAGHKFKDCPHGPKECLGPMAPENMPGPSTENNLSPSTEHNPSPATN